MALKKIETGMDNGATAIQNNFELLDTRATSDTGWSSAGVVYTNGFVMKDNPLEYRIVKFGGTKLQLLFISGIIHNTASVKVVQGAAKAIVTFPAAVKNLLNGTTGNSGSTVGCEIVSNWGNPIELGVDANGNLNAQSRRTDLGANEMVMVNLILVITTK